VDGARDSAAQEEAREAEADSAATRYLMVPAPPQKLLACTAIPEEKVTDSLRYARPAGSPQHTLLPDKGSMGGGLSAAMGRSTVVKRGRVWRNWSRGSLALPSEAVALSPSRLLVAARTARQQIALFQFLFPHALVDQHHRRNLYFLVVGHKISGRSTRAMRSCVARPTHPWSYTLAMVSALSHYSAEPTNDGARLVRNQTPNSTPS
jgi:hypothetical protein